jgi:Tfp pilus assembly protein PilN
MTFRPRLSQTLRDLTVALPDTVWLSELGFSQTGAVLSGETADSAADLVIALAALREFENPRLSGSVSRTPAGREQFELVIDHARAK